MTRRPGNRGSSDDEGHVGHDAHELSPSRPVDAGTMARAQETIAGVMRNGKARLLFPSRHGVVLHSRSGALSNREVLEQDVGLSRTPETVHHYAELAGVDFRGSPVDIVESPDDVAYLDFQGAAARTDAFGVQLGPAAFQDEETLVRTLGHESVHVRQHQEGRITTVTGPLEDEAYAAEDGFVTAWRSNRT